MPSITKKNESSTNTSNVQCKYVLGETWIYTRSLPKKLKHKTTGDHQRVSAARPEEGVGASPLWDKGPFHS